MSAPRWVHVAEWLRSGLQNRLHQFNSGRGLQQPFRLLPAKIEPQAARAQQAAYQPCGNGISGQAAPLSLAAFSSALNSGKRAGMMSSPDKGSIAVLTA